MGISLRFGVVFASRDSMCQGYRIPRRRVPSSWDPAEKIPRPGIPRSRDPTASDPKMARDHLVGLAFPQVDADTLLKYLLQPLAPAEGEQLPRAAIDNMRRALADQQFKLINLCRDWLHSLLPHVLSKRSRVAFGLLLPRDLNRATHIPHARRMLAVPFVGERSTTLSVRADGTCSPLTIGTLHRVQLTHTLRIGTYIGYSLLTLRIATSHWGCGRVRLAQGCGRVRLV